MCVLPHLHPSTAPNPATPSVGDDVDYNLWESPKRGVSSSEDLAPVPGS